MSPLRHWLPEVKINTMSIVSRRLFVAFLAAPLLLAGCSRRIQSVTMADASGLATDALLNVLLGTPPSRRSVITKPEAPLLEKGVYDNVVLTTDEPGFVRVGKGAISEKDIQSVEKEVVRLTSGYFKSQDAPIKDFTISAAPYPLDNASVPDKTLVATFTPETEEGGSPEDRRRGKGKTFVLFRLTVTNPRTGAVLRVREFYSGRDAGVKP